MTSVKRTNLPVPIKIEEKGFQCTKCAFTSSRRWNVKVHMKQIDCVAKLATQSMRECECGMTFTERKSLLRHQRVNYYILLSNIIKNELAQFLK